MLTRDPILKGEPVSSSILLYVLVNIVTQCYTAIIVAGDNILNLLMHPFKCTTATSILMRIINTKVRITAFYSCFSGVLYKCQIIFMNLEILV